MIFLAYLDLLGYLDGQNVYYDIVVDGSNIRDLNAVLRLGLPPERVVKSLILKSRHGVLVASIPMNSRLDIEKVRSVLGSGVGFANPSEISDYGYEIGAVPPLYHRGIGMYLLDKRLATYPKVLSGSGHTDKLIELNVEDIIRLSRPKIVDISD